MGKELAALSEDLALNPHDQCKSYIGGTCRGEGGGRYRQIFLSRLSAPK